MNLSMLPHFFFIIIIFGTILLCYSFITILLTLVVFTRLWLIIRWIRSRLLLIILLIMLFTLLPITIWFSFTKIVFLWNYYISTYWWIFCTYFCSITNNSNLFVFSRLFVAMIIHVFGKVWCNVKWPFFILLFLLYKIKHNCFDNLQWKKN